MTLAHPLRVVFASICVALSASALLAGGIIRNAPTFKESAPFPVIDLDDPSGEREITLADHFEFPEVSGDYAQITTPFGNVYLEFLSGDAPNTVTNFKSYLATDSTPAADQLKYYDNTFVHRSVPGFIVQAGGYKLSAPLNLETITKKATVNNEFKVANTRGTVAMAKLNNQPNSATNEWFVNLADNRSNLDAQNGGFTAFARVMGDGMRIFDQIAAIKRFDVDGSGGSLLNETPLRNYKGGNLAISHFVTFTKLRTVAAETVPSSAKTVPISYSVVASDNPSAATPRIVAGVLTVAPGKFGGRALLTIRATADSGHYTDKVVTVTREGPPRVIKQLPATTATSLGSTITLTADITAWPLFIRWQRLPAGLADIPANWIDIALDDSRFEGADTEYLKIKLTGADSETVGDAHALNGSKLRFRLANTSDAATPLLSRPTLLKVSTTLAFAGKLAPVTTVALGTGSITLSAPAAGGTYPAPTYQWERKAPNGDWAPIVDLKAHTVGSGSVANPEFPAIRSPYSGTKTANLVIRFNGPETLPQNSTAITALETLALHLGQYRCVISHNRGEGPLSVASSPTTLRITTVPVGVATQPAKVVYGFLSYTEADTTNKATISVITKPAASNTQVKYQWQRLNPANGNWDNLVNHVAPTAASGETPANPGAPTPYTGVTTSTLTVRLPSDANLVSGYGLALDGAQYRCVLTNVLKDAPAPFDPADGQAISATAMLRIISGVQYLATNNNFILPGTPPPITGRAYSATGLPAGLSIDNQGAITGFITAKPGVYKVILTVTEGANSLSTTYYILVEPLGGGTAGAFEALLSPADGPHYAKLELQIAGTGALTGTLTTATEVKPLPLKGAVLRDYTTGELSFKAPVVVAIPGTPAGRAYVLTDLLVTPTGHLAVKLHTRASASATPVEVAAATYVPDDNDADSAPTGNFGRQLGVYSKTNFAPWNNVASYNLAITAPTPLADDPEDRPVPAGSGYANAPVSADGRLNFKGKLADGTKFTASLRGGVDASFRLFLRPYSAAPGAVLSAALPLTYPSIFFQRNSVFGDAGKDAYWTKPALPKSTNFREGFGPLGLSMRLEPWYPSSFSDFGFADIAGQGKGKATLEIAGVHLGASASQLPSTVAVTYPQTGPLAVFADLETNDASQFTGKLDTRSGFFQGTFRLTDAGVVRTVAFEGTLLMAYDLDIGTVTAEGFFLLPPPGGPAAEAESGLIQFKSLYDEPNEELDEEDE